MEEGFWCDKHNFYLDKLPSFALKHTPVTLRGQNADRDEGGLSGGFRQAAARSRKETALPFCFS
jgi:hypothetical protein